MSVPSSVRWRHWSVAILAAVLATTTVGSAATARQATPAADVPVAALIPTPGPLPPGELPAGAPLPVVATTSILADLVAQVGGARVAVRSLLPANADPHDYEPAPDDLVAVEDAGLVVLHGLGLDTWSDGLLDGAGGDVPTVVATAGVPTLVSNEDGFADGDPHVWFDPTRVETMVGTLAGALTGVDPAGATTYAARVAAYVAELRALDAGIAAAVATIPDERRKLVTTHDSLRYFADRYSFEIVGTVIPSLDSRAEPGAAEIAALLETIAETGVPVIFAENFGSTELVEELANEAGVTLIDDLYTDSLGEPGSGADTYLGLMRTDAILIVEALR